MVGERGDQQAGTPLHGSMLTERQHHDASQPYSLGTFQLVPDRKLRQLFEPEVGAILQEALAPLRVCLQIDVPCESTVHASDHALRMANRVGLVPEAPTPAL